MTKTFLYSHTSRTLTEKAGMEKPGQNTGMSISLYNDHLSNYVKTMKQYPAYGFNESHEWRGLVEGVDFELKPGPIACYCEPTAIPLPQPSQPSLTEQTVVEEEFERWLNSEIAGLKREVSKAVAMNGMFDKVHIQILHKRLVEVKKKYDEFAAPQPPVSEAVEFGKFVTDNDWVYIPSKDIWLNEEEEENITPKTSEQIYQLFKQSKQ